LTVTIGGFTLKACPATPMSDAELVRQVEAVSARPVEVDTQIQRRAMTDWTLPIEEKDEDKVLRQLISEIAAGLGGNWKPEFPENDSWQYRIVGDGEAKLYLSLEPRGYRNKKDRINISGGIHVGHNGQYVTIYENNMPVTPGNITVAIKRGVPVIVNEIKRRYLPEYLRILGLAIAKRDQENKSVNERLEKLQALAAIIGEDLSRYGRGQNNRDLESFYRGNIKVRVGSDITLTIDSLTLNEAKGLLAIAPRRGYGFEKGEN
jgi:metal-sulfur cluster biosynthetic enzyme